jgi:hypothetical protein
MAKKLFNIYNGTKELRNAIIKENINNMMDKLQDCLSTLEQHNELEEHQSAFLGTLGIIEDLSYKPEDSFTWED